jgi:hypothetical protein
MTEVAIKVCDANVIKEDRWHLTQSPDPSLNVRFSPTTMARTRSRVSYERFIVGQNNHRQLTRSPTHWSLTVR